MLNGWPQAGLGSIVVVAGGVCGSGGSLPWELLPGCPQGLEPSLDTLSGLQSSGQIPPEATM